MESKELAFARAVDRYTEAIKDLPQYELAVEAVTQLLYNIKAGTPEDEIFDDLMAMFPNERVNEHIAAMHAYLDDLMSAYACSQQAIS